MKYEVLTDVQGYVFSIQHTGTFKDFVELNLDDYDLSNGRLHAYKLGKDKLIFDEKKYKEIVEEKQYVANQKEIKDLKARLYETDYIIARTFEEIMALNNPITFVGDVIKILIKYSKKYKSTLIDRKSWRERIEELNG